MRKAKKKMLPRVLSAVLAVTIVLSDNGFATFKPAKAATIKSTTISGSKIYYTQDAGGVHICSDKGAGTAGTATYKAGVKGALVLPSKIGKYAITSIDANAFSGCTKLTSISLGNASSLADIGNYAFNGCTKLLTIDTTGAVGSGFAVIIGNTTKIRNIGKCAFHKCTSIKTVEIRNVTLGEKAFYECSSLSKVTLGSVQVGNSAFEGCSTISQIGMSGTTRLGTSAFAGIGSAKVTNNTTQDIGSSNYFGSSISKVMLYGKFVLNANGGTVKDANDKSVSTLETDYYLKGAAAELPKATKSNYSFKGWYLNGKKVTAGVGYRATVKAEYNGTTTKGVSLDSQGGTQEGTTSIDPVYGNPMPSIIIPHKIYRITYDTGSSNDTQDISYRFLGYYDEKEGSGTKYYDENGSSARTWNKTAQATLYAAWEEAEAEVKSAEKDGYSLEGWSTKPGGSVQYQAGDTIVPTSDMTLYAVWSASDYTITLDDQGATDAGSSSVSASYGGTLPTVTVPKKIYRISYEDTDFSDTEVSNTFCGYFTARSGAGTQYYASDGSGCRTWDRTDNVTLYAGWAAGSVTLPSASKTGYTFKGWATGNSGSVTYTGGQTVYPSGDMTLYPVFQSNNYSITLDSQGATTAGDDKVDAAYDEELPTIRVPERKYTVTYEYVNEYNENVSDKVEAEYGFMGYYDEKNGRGTQYFDSDGYGSTWDKTGKTTLYADWEEPEINISEPDTERTGYTFKGWSLTPGGSIAYKDGDTLIPKQNVTLYGIWVANTYTLTLECGEYEDNDEDNSNEDESNVDDETSRDESSEKIVVTPGTKMLTVQYGNLMPDIKVPTMTNYTFLGYYDEEEGGEMYFDASGHAVRAWDKDGDESLYGVWKLTKVPYYEKTYTQNENGNYDVVIVKKRAELDTRVTKNASSVKPADGYTLNKTASVLSGSVKNGYTVIKVYIDRTKATLTYDLTGGKNDAITNMTTYWGAEIELTDEEPVRKGYLFTGWGKTAASTSTITDIVLDKKGNTVYALWEKDEYEDENGMDEDPSNSGDVIGEQGDDETTYTLTFENRTMPVEEEKTEPDTFDADVYDVTVYDTLEDENVEFKNGTVAAYVKENEKYPASVTVPSRTNYTFLGYYDAESASDGEKIYDAAGKIVKTLTASDNTTLYAVWKMDNVPYFEVTCKQSEDGDYFASATRKRAAAGSTVSITESSVKIPAGYKLNKDKTVLSGKVINGSCPVIVYLDRNGESVSDEDDTPLPSETQAPSDDVSDKTDDVQDGEVIGSQEDGLEIDFESKTFDTSQEAEEPDSSLLDQNTYDVKYVDTLEREEITFKKGTVKAYVKENTVLPEEITTPFRTNYRFMGYYDADNVSEGEKYYDSDGVRVYTGKVTENLTLYAVWMLEKAPYFEVTYTQNADKSYNATVKRKRSLVDKIVEVDEAEITVPSGYTFKRSKSRLSGIVENGNVPIRIYLDITPKKTISLAKTAAVGKGETVSLAVKGDTIKRVSVTDKKRVSAAISGTSVKVKGLRTGKTKLTVVSQSGAKAVCTITVKKAPSKLTAKKKVTLRKGKKYRWLVHLPKNTQSRITYVSSSKKVASVNKNGMITAKKKGKVTITARSFNQKTCKIKVTVK